MLLEEFGYDYKKDTYSNKNPAYFVVFNNITSNIIDWIYETTPSKQVFIVCDFTHAEIIVYKYWRAHIIVTEDGSSLEEKINCALTFSKNNEIETYSIFYEKA